MFMKKRSVSNGLKQKNKFSLRKTFKRNTDEFCKNTTLHGLKYITSDELYPSERCFFGISFILVLILSSIFIFKVYDKWQTSPVIFGINPEPTFITNEPFPAVTICNLNQALRSKASRFSNSSRENRMLKMLCKNNVNATNNNSEKTWNDLPEFIVNVSQPCHKMVVGCRFAGSELNCSQVFHPIVTDEGLCCVFNMLHPKFMYIGENPFVVKRFSTDTNVPVDWYAERGYPKDLSKDLNFFPRTTPGVGESLGLSITLDVQYDEYYCSSGNSVGFKIAIHSPNESPNVLETGVLVAPGRETKLRIRPEKIETDQHLRTVKKKYRHCLFHNEGRLKYFAHYTQRNCEMECIAEMVLQHCGCISFYMPKVYENVTICSIYKNSCVEKVRLRKDPTIESCIDKCYPSCYDLTFYVDVFTAIISHYGFEIVNQKVEDFDHIYVEKNIGVVNMYFKENSFRSHLQTEFIGISDFLSNVGGLMGLFLGFSFISIAEFFYFAIMRPCRSLLKRKNSKGIAVNSIPVSGTIKKISKSQRNHLSDMRKYSKQHFVDCEKIGKRKIFDKFMASQRCDEDNIFEYKDDNLLSISKSLESKEHKQEDFIS